MTTDEALVALNMLPCIGPVRIRRLLAALGSAEAVLGAPSSRLRRVDGIGPESAEIIHSWERHADLATELAEADRRGLAVLTENSPGWPAPLRELPDAPVVLYVWGELRESDQHAVAIVGSRRTTHYGRDSAKRLSFQIARAGFTIISGLARGIDTAAHEGAVAAEGRTIGVLGSGLAQLYPPENMPLAEKIAEGHGAIVSEFPLHTPPDKQTFPQRNRIVAGWCRGLLVVECPSRSGALITANLAGEYGRQLFAVPGPIDRPSSAGCHDLIRTGATLVTNGSEVVEDLSFLPLRAAEAPAPTPVALPELTPEEAAVLDVLDSRERHIDELTTTTGLPPALISATLLRLEMKKLVKQLPGTYFVRVV